MAAAGGGLIRAKKLHEILAGRLGGGVRAAMVFNHDGALLGAASLPSEGSIVAEAAGGGEGGGAAGGEGAEVVVMKGGEEGAAGLVVMPTKEETKEAQVMAAVTSHIWSTYEGMGVEPGQPLETLIFELEGARIVALPAGAHHLVCLVGTGAAAVGMLLTKAQALGDYVREAFRAIVVG